MFVVSAPLLILSLALPLRQDRPPVPGNPDARLTEALREELEFVDPLRAGWESEGLGAAAQGRLDALAELLRSPRDDLAARLADWVPAEFVCGPLRPGGLETVFVDGAFRVLRPPTDPAEEARLRGPHGLARALQALRVAFGPDEVYTKLKVSGVSPGTDGSFETHVRYEAAGGTRGPAVQPGDPEPEEVWIQQRASWVCTWSPGPGEAPLLTGIQADGFEYVRSPRRLFGDRTEALLGDLEPGVWTVGVGDWRRRLDTRLGVPLLGHPAGIAIGDVDGNGLEDLYLCQPGGVPNQLYLRGRDGSLRNASRGSGVDFLDFSRGALILELDGDGSRDLVVVVAGDIVFLSQADTEAGVRFHVVTSVPAVNTTSLAAADYDLDGDLDLYACSYFDPYSGGGSGAYPLPYHDANNGQPNLLLENRGDFEFVDVTAAVGLDRNNTRFSFAAAWEDFDRDGDPDLYVANDFGRNSLYRNDGGKFVDIAAAAGVEDISAGMGVAWGDYDGDGWYDLLVSNMYSSAGNRVTYQRNFRPEWSDELRSDYQKHARGNSLFRNRGDGTFEDVSEQAGISMGRWAWGSRFVDLNNDGRLDVLVPNGFLTQARKDDL